MKTVRRITTIKNYWFLVLLFGAILAIAIFTFTVYLDKSGVEPVLNTDKNISQISELETSHVQISEMDNCEKIRKTPDKWVCFAELGRNATSAENCMTTVPDSQAACIGGYIAMGGNGICNENACFFGYGYISKKTDCNNEYCTLGAAIRTKNLTLCNATELKDSCYSFLAQKLKNATLCLDAGVEKEDCLFRLIISSETMKGVTKEVCDMQPESEKNFCYALHEHNASMCEFSKDFKEDCYTKLAASEKNLSLCDFSGNSKEFCMWNIAVLTNDMVLCEKLATKKELCYNDIAIKTSNISLCKNSGEYVQNCIFTIVSSQDLEAASCELLENKDQCYFAAADKRADSDLCNKSGRFSSYCYAILARKTADPELCEKSGDHEGICRIELAAILQNPVLCENTPDKQGCLFNIVKNTIDGSKLDWSICENTGIYKDECYYLLSIKTGDRSLCKKSGLFLDDCMNPRPLDEPLEYQPTNSEDYTTGDSR